MAQSFSYLTTTGKSHLGLVRKQNEDSIGVHPDAGWFCVADGMGGEDAGDKASTFAVEALAAEFDKFPAAVDVDHLHTRKILSGYAAIKANAHIRDFVRKQGLEQSGSTLALLMFDPNQPSKALVMHAGDSRIYRLRDGAFAQLTTDHSVAEEAGVKDEKDVPLMFRGMVTRALGIKPEIDPEYQTIDVKAEDLYLICSDGLSGMVADQELHLILGQKDYPSLEALADQLIEAALAGGGKDNISAVLIRIGELPERPSETLKCIDPPEDDELLALKKRCDQKEEDDEEPSTLDSQDPTDSSNMTRDDPASPTDDLVPLTPTDDRVITADIPTDDSGSGSTDRMREKLKSLFKPKTKG